ncbi:MAG TPA: PilZ domain-containing protein [Terriglobales bacterium]|nr:PilZ domain-containing protein [Terriglobales bacterium]
MPTTDRRHSPRTKLDQLAYLNIEPDNGGIVLNVSEEGLCFRSMSPIQPDGPLRLSLQELNRKIDICGELVWSDDVKKSGGVRFDTLTKEARERISDWIQPSDPVVGARSTLGAALLKALPTADSRRITRPLRPAIETWKSPRRLKISGFTRGLAAGILLSLATFSVLLFSYQHRADFGESLIRVGKRLAGKPAADSAPQSTPQPIVAVNPAPPAQAAIAAEAKNAVKTSLHEESSPADAKADDVTVRLSTPPRPAAPAPKAAVSSTNIMHESNSAATESATSELNPPTLPATKSANTIFSLFPKSERPASIPKPELMAASVHSEVAPSLSRSPMSLRVQMFFDLGRFKREPMATGLREKLAELGVESTVVPKRRLWGNSYQVLAGPYDDGNAEKHIYAALLSHGYKPRPFERGTRDFAFHSKVTIDGSPLPTGNFTVAWESYIADARVKFTHGNDLVAAVDGTWVKHSAKFDQNEYVYQLQPDGSRPLLELHFGGMDRALVFRKE